MQWEGFLHWCVIIIPIWWISSSICEALCNCVLKTAMQIKLCFFVIIFIIVLRRKMSTQAFAGGLVSISQFLKWRGNEEAKKIWWRNWRSSWEQLKRNKKKMQANKTTEKAKAYLGQVQREFTEGKKGKLNSKEQIVASFIRTVRILIVWSLFASSNRGIRY